MELKFNDKVAVITGAGNGLGKNYALELAKRGAKVVVNDISSSPNGSLTGVGNAAQEVVEEITKLGGEATADFHSVAEEEGAKNLIDFAVEKYGKVDILINNAGIIHDKSFLKMNAEDFDRVIKVHLYGGFYVTKAAFENMVKNQYGRIIMTSSVSGFYGNFGQSAYDTAKLGLVGLMKCLKEEGQKHNVHINTIAPLATTRHAEGILPPEVMELLKPEYVTAMVTYLCSQDCTANGHIIGASGGFYNRYEIFEGQGFTFKDVEEVTPEMILEKYGMITDLTEVQNFPNTTKALDPFYKKIMNK